MVLNMSLNINSEEFDRLSAPLSLDMTALFSVMKDDVFSLIDKAEKEGWTTEKLITEVRDLI